MNRIVAIVGALAVLNGFAAEKKESPFKALDEARAGFNKQEGEVFRGTSAAGDATAFETAAFAPSNTHTRGLVFSKAWKGRRLAYYVHGSDPAWGAADPKQTDAFAVLHPMKDRPQKKTPLYVVLHSAGHSLETCIQCIDFNGPNHDIYRPPADCYGLILDCKRNAKTDWWWGSGAKGFEPSPCERRVMACVRWAIAKFDIDPNRVYLSGNSMGGSGTLGIGLRNGDVFAAIKANVPAGVDHCAERMLFRDDADPSLVAKIPDPPVLVDYSAPNDGWSKGHNGFYAQMAKRRYALLGFWGNFGHANRDPDIAKFNDIIHSLDWLSIRRNEAYPVFTAADCDTPIDFTFSKGGAKGPGQVNGFFRWKNIKDTKSEFAMELRITTSNELCSAFFNPPASASAEVSVRRLQNFRAKPGDRLKWSFGTASGAATAASDGRIDCGKLTLSQKPQTLKLWCN